MPSRRLFLASILAETACAHATNADARILLDRAIEAAGGRRALDRALVLAWRGDAIVHAGDGRRIEISVETVVEPFSYARSETWLTSAGRSSLRVLEIDGDQGIAQIGAERRPLSIAVLANERAQYALYGLMRLTPLLNAPIELAPLPADAPTARYALRTRHPNAVPTVLIFDAGYRLAGAENSVPDPQTGLPVAQRFEFSDTIMGGGVRWPKRLSIYQNGVLFFELRLSRFEPRLLR